MSQSLIDPNNPVLPRSQSPVPEPINPLPGVTQVQTETGSPAITSDVALSTACPLQVEDRPSPPDSTALDATAHPLSESKAGPDGVFWTNTASVSSRKSKANTLRRVKRCPQCDSLILLREGASLHAFQEHVGKLNCRQSAKALRDKKGQKSLAAFFNRPTTTPAIQQSTSTSENSLEINSDPPPPPSSPQQPFRSSLPPILEEDSNVESEWLSIKPDSASVLSTRCKGVEFSFGQSIFLEYPWHLHYFEELPYHFSAIESKGTQFRIRSNKCIGMPRTGESTCYACQDLKTCKEVTRLQA